MRMNLNRALLSIVAPALATLLVAASSWSGSDDGESRHDPQHKVTHLAKMLDLTEEQEASVQTLFASSMEESEVDRARLHVLKEQLLQPDAFDAGTAQVAADEIGQITGRMVYRMASSYASIYQLLDDEQKVEMNELVELSEKRGGKRRGHHRFPF